MHLWWYQQSSLLSFHFQRSVCGMSRINYVQIEEKQIGSYEFMW